ncbi:MAG: glycosyltransferase family 2 protein [Mycoplasma sp.]|nr:glycosyltransferase family 2 protein [Mycoplasma sp.]
MKELFTIIICFRNPNVNHLEICLDSLTKQKFKNFNCVLVDDGSDNGINYFGFVKQKLSEVNYSYHENRKNLGLGASRNIGVELATGEYVLFLDADDFLTMDCLHYLNKKILENSDLDLICFNYMELYESCYESKNKLITEKKLDEEIFSNNVSKKMLKYLYDKFQTDWRYCYSKLFLIENNIQHRNENIYFEDVIFNLHCKNSFKKMLCTTKRLYFYNRNNLDSIIRNFNSKESAQMILDNTYWIYNSLRINNLLNKNFFFYVLYFFRQFILINNNQNNWIFLKELSLKNKFISLRFLTFKIWFICRFLVLSKRAGKKICAAVEKRDLKIKNEMILKNMVKE